MGPGFALKLMDGGVEHFTTREECAEENEAHFRPKLVLLLEMRGDTVRCRFVIIFAVVASDVGNLVVLRGR